MLFSKRRKSGKKQTQTRCSPIPSLIGHCKQSAVLLVASLFLKGCCGPSVVGVAVGVDIKEVVN